MKMSPETNGLTKYRVNRLEEDISRLHEKIDQHETKRLETHNKMYKSLSGINTQLSTIQTDMKWMKWIAGGVGSAGGVVGGVLWAFFGFK